MMPPTPETLNATPDNLAKLARLIAIGQPLNEEAVSETIDLCVAAWRSSELRLAEVEKPLHDAIRALAAWVPEQSRPTDYQTAFGYPTEEGDNGMPFLSETFLYPMLGKDDARTLLSLWRNLATASRIPLDRFGDIPVAFAPDAPKEKP